MGETSRRQTGEMSELQAAELGREGWEIEGRETAEEQEAAEGRLSEQCPQLTLECK